MLSCTYYTQSTSIRGVNTSQLLFYNLSYPKPTPSRFVNLKKFATYEE